MDKRVAERSAHTQLERCPGFVTPGEPSKNFIATLSLGALIWAAVAKDPGFNPRSLLELLKRRGKFRHEDFSKLHLNKPLDLKSLKTEWLSAVAYAERFIEERPADELGCLYYSKSNEKFIAPTPNHIRGKDYELHYGKAGGVLPVIASP